MPPADDPLIADERAHLAHARTCLREMRERTRSLDALGGDAVSQEYLKAELHRRALSLADEPSAPLFFGRLDYREPAERFHIGRRHIHDDAGDPVVIDWRADIARPFYRATRDDPLGVALRRRFGFSGGDLTAYEDETFTGEETGASGIVTDEIERPRSGPMRDIVATIQPDQDDLVRAELPVTVCVQGAPGTGKTAVGLHRAAYLLYAHRERLRRAGVLVVGPNRSFLSYIHQVLPALGEMEVRQVTVDELVAHVPVRAADTPYVAGLKGDARMADVLRRAVWSAVREPAEPLVVPRGSRRWRVPAYELARMIGDLRARDLRYAPARAMLPKRIASAIVTRMEESGDAAGDRTAASLASAPTVKRFVGEVWPPTDPVRVVFRLLTDPDALAQAASGVLTDCEQQALLWTRRPRSPRSASWSLADTVLIDEAIDLIERVPTFGHVVLDEAQDLSAMQCRAVGRRCGSGSATVLGDIAQGTTPWATESWYETLAHLGKTGARVETLSRGYRVPREIIDYASLLLPHAAPDVPPPLSVRQSAGSLHVRPVGHEELTAEVVRHARQALRDEGSVGIVLAEAAAGRIAAALQHADVAHRVLADDAGDVDEEQRLAVVPASLAKGLEFDHVIVVEPADIVAGHVRGLRRLYVVLTRAVSRLEILHAGALPDPLAALP